MGRHIAGGTTATASSARATRAAATSRCSLRISREGAVMRVTVVSLTVLLSGCLSYTRLGPAAPPRGVEVVVKPSAPLDARVGEVTIHGVTVVEGRVAYADPGSLVTIPRSQIGELKQKRVSAWKTAVALGAGGAAIAAILASVGSLGGSSSGGGPPKPGASIQAPCLSRLTAPNGCSSGRCPDRPCEDRSPHPRPACWSGLAQ